MVLTEHQNDALSELINIAFARTAASLSHLSGHRVLLDPPHVGVYPTENLIGELSGTIEGEIASVHQIFSGPLAGDAFLMLNYDAALMLSDLLVEPTVHSKHLDASACEVLTEIGNILLNACLGVFGNLLKVQVSFSMPRLHLERLDEVLRSISIGEEELRYAVVVTTSFHIRARGVSGWMVIVLGVSSLERLLRAVEQWEQSQS